MNTTTPLKEVIAYTDGSALGNGQAVTRAAGAAILSHSTMVKAFGAYFGSQTNQQAEIRACTLAVKSLKEPCRLHIYTDSKYVVETMCGRFRRKANHEMWRELDEAISQGGHVVTFEWKRGHNGDPQQEAADQLARSVAELGRVEPFMLSEAVAAFRCNWSIPSQAFANGTQQLGQPSTATTAVALA